MNIEFLGIIRQEVEHLSTTNVSGLKNMPVCIMIVVTILLLGLLKNILVEKK